MPYHAPDPTVARHAEGNRMYDTMRQLSYWLHTAKDVYIITEMCVDCHIHRRHLTHPRSLQLLPAAGPLEFVAIDRLSHLPEMKTGNRFTVLVTD